MSYGFWLVCDPDNDAWLGLIDQLRTLGPRAPIRTIPFQDEWAEVKSTAWWDIQVYRYRPHPPQHLKGRLPMFYELFYTETEEGCLWLQLNTPPGATELPTDETALGTITKLHQQYLVYAKRS